MMIVFTHPDKNMKIPVRAFDIEAAEPYIVKARVPTFNEDIMARAEAGEDIPQDEIEAGIISHTEHFEFFGTDLLLKSGRTLRVKERPTTVMKRLANAGVEFA